MDEKIEQIRSDAISWLLQESMGCNDLPILTEPCKRCGGCPDVSVKHGFSTHQCGGLQWYDRCANDCGSRKLCDCTAKGAANE